MGLDRVEREARACGWLAEVEPYLAEPADRQAHAALWWLGAAALVGGLIAWFVADAPYVLCFLLVAWIVVLLVVRCDEGANRGGLARHVLAAARAESTSSFLREAATVLYWLERLTPPDGALPDLTGALLAEIAPPGIPASSRQALEYLSRYSEEWAAWRAEHGLPPGVEDIDDLEDEQVALCVEAERDGRLPPGLRQIREALQADAKGLRR